MAVFEKALPYVLRHEGGWSDHPADPGGATNFGITLKTAQRHGIKTKDELKAITPDKVAEIYRKDYWRFDAVEDQRVATKLFDMAVNMGPGTAMRLLAHVTMGGNEVSPAANNFRACNAADPGDLLDRLCNVCAWHYREIADNKPAMRVFLNGWLRRAAEVPDA